MNRQLFLILLITFSITVAYGQDTTYYTNDGLKLQCKEKADYYEVINEIDSYGSKKEVSGYYISGTKKSSKTIAITNNNYVILKKAKPNWGVDGKYQEWFENGKLKMTSNYFNGKRIDELRTYWENGNLKREDKYVDDKQPFTNEKFISGKCYDNA